MIALLFLLFLFCGTAQAQVASPMLAPARIEEPMSVPNGGPPQLVGYSGPNTPENETIIGDVTLARTAASQYTATVHSVNGVTAGNVATLNVGAGLTVGAGSMLDLITPIPISSGGLGGATAPLTDQILIAQSPTVYAPMPVGGDITITTNGQVTVHKVNGNAPGGTCAANQFVDVIDSSGRPTCTQPTITGVPNGNPNQLIGYSAANVGESQTISGGPGGCTVTRTGANAAQIACSTYAPTASPSFTGDVIMPGTLGANHWNDVGIFAVTATFGGAATAGSFSAPQFMVNSGTGSYSAAAGASYHQPGFTGTYPNNALWNQSGIQNMQSIGIGQPTGNDPLGITLNQNAATIVGLTNTNSGASATAMFVAHNGSYTARFGINGTGTGSGPTIADWGFLASDQGIQYSTQGGLPHQFSVNGQVVANIAANGLHLPNPLEVGSGGTGITTAPSQNQILIAQSAINYAPQTVSGDLTLASTGAATVGTSGVYQPQLYVTTMANCGVTYQAQGGYWYKVGKHVDLYFTIQLSSLGTCSNGPLYVSVPFQPTINGGISMDLIQIVPLVVGGNVAPGSIVIAQGGGTTVMGTGVLGLGALMNGNVLQMTASNLQPNSTIRGRVVYLTD